MAAGASDVSIAVFTGKSLQALPSCQCPTHRDRIGKLEVTAMGDAAGDPRHRNRQGRQLTLEQQRRGLAIDAGRGCHDDLRYGVGANAIDELRDGQILRADAFEWRKQTSENEVASTHGSRPFDGDEIVHSSHDAKNARVALAVCADVAHGTRGVDLRHIAAALAGA